MTSKTPSDGDSEEETPYYSTQIDSLETISVSTLLELALELFEDEDASFEDVQKTVSFGEAYLPLPGEDNHSEYYNSVYSRIVSELQRETVDEVCYKTVLSTFATYEVGASKEEMNAFAEEVSVNWFDFIVRY